MTKNYAFTFTVPVEVTAQVTVAADSTEAALIAAHDAALDSAKWSSVKVRNLMTDTIELISQGATAPIATKPNFEVRWYFDMDKQVLDSEATAFYTHEYEAFDAIQHKFETDSPHAWAAIIRLDDRKKIYEKRAPRGGWEVLLYENGQLTTTHSWNRSFEDAALVLKSLMADSDYLTASANHDCKIEIRDFTDRIRGPLLIRTIR